MSLPACTPEATTALQTWVSKDFSPSLFLMPRNATLGVLSSSVVLLPAGPLPVLPADALRAPLPPRKLEKQDLGQPKNRYAGSIT